MLSACVIVRPIRPRYTSPTTKSSKKRPSQPFFSAMVRSGMCGSSGGALGALPACFDGLVVAKDALRALEDRLLHYLASEHDAAHARRDRLVERFRHRARMLDFI